MSIAVSGSSQPVSLGPGYSIRAPGWTGQADVVAGAMQRLRAASNAQRGLDALDDALRKEQVIETKRIELLLHPVAGAAASLRSPTGLGEVELEVPDPGPDHAAVVLSVDDAGALRWHLPHASSGGSTTTRGSGAGLRFRIPAEMPPPPAAVALQQRSLFGAIGRRVLKVLVYPVTDPITGAIGKLIARRWEERKRPHRLRRFRPGEHRNGQAPNLHAPALQSMAAGGPLLMFVHGTFSTAHGGFGDLPDATLAALHQRYGDRVIAFDHPTLHLGPVDNARWLLSALPAQPITIDIVSHSRGGLVARALAERPAPFRLDHSQVNVRRVVFAATPNAGTMLADADHMVTMVDRLTTALTLLPSGAAAEMLEALVTVVKVLGHGVLEGLDGLAAMQPQGPFIKTLNASGPTRDGYHAIAADFEPNDRGLRALLYGAADNALDRVFGQAANDLVVPTDGVHHENGAGGFPIDSTRLLSYGTADGVMHTNLFGQPAVSARLLQWLQ